MKNTHESSEDKTGSHVITGRDAEMPDDRRANNKVGPSPTPGQSNGVVNEGFEIPEGYVLQQEGVEMTPL